MAVECMQIAIKKMRNMCPCVRCASMLNMPYPTPTPPTLPSSPPLLLCPVDLYARCGLKQRRFFSYSASDVVQTFLPSGKQQDRSSCHWALKAQPAYLYRPLPTPPLTAPRSRPATIHFELLNFEKATRAKTDIIFEDSGCSRSKKTKKK